MQFLKEYLRNLTIHLFLGFAIFILFPEFMHQAIQLLGYLFGPLVVVMILVAALPRKRRYKRNQIPFR